MKYTFSTRDFLRGLLMAVGTAVVTIIVETVSAGTLTFNWTAIATAGIGAAGVYLLKNYLTDDVAVAKTILIDNAANTVEAAKVDAIKTKTATTKKK